MFASVAVFTLALASSVQALPRLPQIEVRQATNTSSAAPVLPTTAPSCASTCWTTKISQAPQYGLDPSNVASLCASNAWVTAYNNCLGDHCNSTDTSAGQSAEGGVCANIMSSASSQMSSQSSAMSSLSAVATGVVASVSSMEMSASSAISSAEAAASSQAAAAPSSSASIYSSLSAYEASVVGSLSSVAASASMSLVSAESSISAGPTAAPSSTAAPSGGSGSGAAGLSVSGGLAAIAVAMTFML